MELLRPVCQEFGRVLIELLCSIVGHDPELEMEYVQTLYTSDVRDAYYCKRCGEDVTWEVMQDFRRKHNIAKEE